MKDALPPHGPCTLPSLLPSNNNIPHTALCHRVESGCKNVPHIKELTPFNERNPLNPFTPVKVNPDSNPN